MATYYAVWVGKKPGVYDSWDLCKEQVDKFAGAKYCKLKAKSLSQAQAEFKLGFGAVLKSKNSEQSNNENKIHQSSSTSISKGNNPLRDVLTVDGASNGKNCEYQAKWYPSCQLAFSSEVYEGGTNNIAEFLGLVEAIKYLVNNNKPLMVYTDSVTAMAWVRDKSANTTARSSGKLTKQLDELISQAEEYLRLNHDKLSQLQVLKWHTDKWGEIPADFGRK